MAASGAFVAAVGDNKAAAEVHSSDDSDTSEASAEVRGQIAAGEDVREHRVRSRQHGGLMIRRPGKATAAAESQPLCASVSTTVRLYAPPSLGAANEEYVMRGGSLKEPWLMTGVEEKTDVLDTELILRGGYLHSPVLLTGLTCIDGRKFLRVQKSNPDFCLFLTGRYPYQKPLKNARIFEDMRLRAADTQKGILEKHRLAVSGDADEAVLEAKAKMRKICPDKEEISTKRCHKRRRGVMPKYAEVEMNRTESTTWHPVCLMTATSANVSMEATTENLLSLLQIVQTQIDVPDPVGSQPSTPKRSLRRRKSDDHYKKGSPGNRSYWINSKGWVTCHKPGKSTPGSGSGSTDAKRRRFTKAAVAPSKPIQKLHRRSKCKRSGDNRAANRVLKRDGDVSTESFGQESSDGEE